MLNEVINNYYIYTALFYRWHATNVTNLNPKTVNDSPFNFEHLNLQVLHLQVLKRKENSIFIEVDLETKDDPSYDHIYGS